MEIGFPQIAENDSQCVGLRRIEARLLEPLDDLQCVEWSRYRFDRQPRRL
jgi:hypothetical protein